MIMPVLKTEVIIAAVEYLTHNQRHYSKYCKTFSRLTLYLNIDTVSLERRNAMKKKDLERELEKLGFKFLREGGNHEIWTNGVIPHGVID